jgi:hypothetical protein
MARKRKVVIENPTLERDERTGALLNRSKSSHMQHRARKAFINSRNEEVVVLRSEVDSMRNDIAELKALLSKTTKANKVKETKATLLTEE